MQVYKVLTEFRFDAGAAIAESGRLQSAVEGISGAADEALLKFKHLGIHLAAQFGLGASGIIGTLKEAISSTDKFRTSQLALANVIDSYSVPFEARMQMAAEAMENINKLASEFSLPADQLLAFTKVLGPMLKSKGLSGHNFSTAIDISRNLLKASPALGIDPSFVQGQLLRMIEGQASSGDTLFNRLSGDTQTMKKFLGNSKGFNMLSEAQRVSTLRQALSEFTKDTKILEENVKTVSGQIRALKNNLTGAFSILRPIGEVLTGPILNAMMQINKYLRIEGAKVSKAIARMIEPFLKTPGVFIANLMQLKSLKEDLDLAGAVMKITGALLLFKELFVFFGFNIPIITPMLEAFAKAISLLEKNITISSFSSMNPQKLFRSPLFNNSMKTATTGIALGFENIMLMASRFVVFLEYLSRASSTIFTAFNQIVIFISRILVPLTLLVLLFQFVSRAIHHAKMFAAETMAAYLPRIAEAFAVISRGFGELVSGFDLLAKGVGFILDPTKFLGFINLVGIFTNSLEYLGAALALVLMGFQGLAFGILEFLGQIKNAAMGKGFDIQSIATAFDAGMEDIFEKLYQKVEDGDAVASMTMNVGNIEINNQFKEQMDPDRIAFALVKTIERVATNPLQPSGRSFGRLVE